MAIKLPIDRSVVVTVTRADKFPTTAGFNTALMLNSTALSGKVDATTRTRLYSNMTEVAVDWSPATEAYKAATRFFQAQVRPPQLKIGYLNPAASSVTAELDALYQYDLDWFWLLHTNEFNDTAAQRAIMDWAETKEVIFGGDSNDTDTELPAEIDDPTSTVTISIASPGVVTWTAHGLQNGDQVRFTTSGALPGGLSPVATYYVVGASTNTFNVAATAGGPAITTTGTQSGTHTATSPRYGGSVAEYAEQKAYDRTAVFYHTDPGSYLAAGAFAYSSGRDFDRSNYRLAQAGRIDSGQAYTLKFKTFPGVTPISRPSAVVQAITGFIPGLGSDEAQGHRANTYVNMGGRNMLVEGTVASGAFIDEIHTISWIKARVQESVFGVLSNNPRIPYTNQGVGFLIEAGINPPMRRAFAAGLIAPRVGDDGLLVPEFQVAVDDVANIPVSQRRNRIAPDIKVTFQYANAIHFVSVTMQLQY
ncbi:DUF3383 domain-containing protein [Methylobacterium terricola]|uniref:DUF3383 domain-containing protein n=1 Tax=Methylobacterium terricola TaxID=2583531 RepID=A0A5C4LLI8_9HYPH|nr:DUF3383 family protein [Methylobacterium terricola]TNC14913.1 DUF3383 domain-containing protein [Methylobacterium terricola]